LLLKDVKTFLRWCGVALHLAAEDEDVIHVDSHDPSSRSSLKIHSSSFGKLPDCWFKLKNMIKAQTNLCCLERQLFFHSSPSLICMFVVTPADIWLGKNIKALALDAL